MNVIKINEFSLADFLTAVCGKRKKIFVFTICFAFLGFIVASFTPKQYTSSASIVPEIGNEEDVNGGFSSLVSLAGINLGGGMDAIGPDLYPTVVASNDFVVGLLYTQVTLTNGKKTTFLDFLRNGTEVSPLGLIMKPLDKLISLFESDSSNSMTDKRINAERMSMKEYRLVEGVKGAISCKEDAQTGMITISYTCQDPIVAKTMVDTLMNHLQCFITRYRTSKSRNDLLYYQRLEQESLAEYKKTQEAYSYYCDTHKGENLLQAYASQRDKLENDLSMAVQSYTQMKQQVITAQARVQETTPAFTVVEQSYVPPRHSSPKRMLMTILYGFLGFVGIVGKIYLVLLFKKDA